MKDIIEYPGKLRVISAILRHVTRPREVRMGGPRVGYGDFPQNQYPSHYSSNDPNESEMGHG
jgi:hypothetical protein